MKELKNNILGIAGEVFVESYCRQNNIKYKKATKEEDLTLGIDAYIGDKKIPVDVKNTENVYFCQILDDGTINVRHPFKKNSKAQDYFFVKVDGSGQGKFIEQISVKEKLLRDFIKDEGNLTKLYAYLQAIEHLNYKMVGADLGSAAFKIKKDILKYCKKNVGLSYDEPVGGTQDISFHFHIQSAINKPTIQSLNSIRGLIKDKLNNESLKEIPQDNIIVIKI